MAFNTHRITIGFALTLVLLPAAFAQSVATTATPQTAISAQAGSRIIDTGRLDNTRLLTRLPGGGVPPTTHPGSPGPAPDDSRAMTLNGVRVIGAGSLTPVEIQAAWASQRGNQVRLQDIYAIADRIGAAYAARGFALYQVRVPAQDFSGGVAVIAVTEGQVANVTIDGDTVGADLSLLRAYAARITADRPLHQATLERYILLMNDIAGLKVGSAFKPVPGHPGAVELDLTIARKGIEYGAGFTNQGQALLSRSSIDVNIAVNSLLREGDRTQVVFGAPVSFGRYQFYGGVHREPIGTDGATLVANAGYLVTHPSGNLVSGDAVTAGLLLSYPVIRAVKESFVVSAGLDLLNSNNAVLGSTLSDERTRVARGSLVYALQDGWQGTTTAALTASFGLDSLGARRGSIAAGGPTFSKVTASLSREQTLPLTFILRLNAAGQVAPGHLPLSEQFAFGGANFGRSFDAGAVLGDQGFAASAEFAYPLPAAWALPFTAGYEVFAYADYGRVYASRTPFQYSTDHGSSAGFGVRAKVLDKVTLELDLARTLHQPLQVPGRAASRVVFGVRGTF